MKIVWLNLRKRGRSRPVATVLEKLILEFRPDVVFFQETSPARTSAVFNFPTMRPIFISDDLSLLGADNISSYDIFYRQPFALGVMISNIAFINVHLSPYRSADRQAQLSAIYGLIQTVTSYRIIIGGDFNLAPREIDGLVDGVPSSFTTRRERTALDDILTTFDLVDIFSDIGQHDYTVTRVIGGRCLQFRCDLVLCSRVLRNRVSARYIHATRSGSLAFTDHSGLYVEVLDE